ncbi:ATPase [Caulobacter sp. CCUG 60055]|uniref:SRPBCC family protein n=1 Tax=Caulobacter sp. CCUG 60055 TaxID=2100090 RepID=UPI001FA75FEC|nr:SRPBCC family protein [Caulobacter sp. CCUG 60055]MCI3180015.1 ATPase [Caulobacter sp. CCUG 60055]
MTDAAKTVTVRVAHRFAAAPERVFDAWLDPERASRWLFATPTGRMARAEIDPRVGGRFAFVDRRDGVDVEHVGEYVEIDRPRRLVFTFAVPMYSPLVTTVTIDIAPSGSGCELTLTHEGVLAEYAENTPKGWRMILDGLASVVS